MNPSRDMAIQDQAGHDPPGLDLDASLLTGGWLVYAVGLGVIGG
jgi:hypothetical protein